MAMMNKLLPALGSAMAILAVSACAGAGSQTQGGQAPSLDANQDVSIVFESYNLKQAGVWTDTVNGLVDEFEKEHPNIQVKAQPPIGDTSSNSAIVSSVQQQMVAGNPPDVAQLTFDGFDFIVNSLGVKPLDSLVGKDEVQQAISGGDYPIHPNVAKLGDYNGQTYGIPYVVSTPILFYNKTVLDEAGVKNPDFSTWDSTLEVAKQVTEKLGRPALDVSCLPAYGDWCMQGIIKSNGGRVVSEDHSTVEFGSDAAIGAVQKMRDLFDAGVLHNSLTDTEGLADGKVAMDLTSSVMQGTYQQAADANNWELSAAKMPAFDGKPVVPTNSGSALFIITQDQAKQAAAWEFIKFMTSPESQSTINKNIGYVPMREGITDEGAPLGDWYKDNPLVQPNIEQLDSLQPWDAYPGANYVDVSKTFIEAVQQSVYYDGDVSKTMKDAEAKAKSLIE